MTTDIVTKTCTKCGESKSISLFSKNKRSKDGLESRCKACASAYTAAWATKNAQARAQSGFLMPTHKECAACGETKAVFSKDKGSKYGIRPKCKACESASNAAYRAENHDARRAYTSTYHAENREAIRARNAAYYADNREAVLEKNAAWRAKNTEKVRAANSAWYAANTERLKAATSAWSRANPDARRTHSQNRRARKMQNGGKLSKDLGPKLLECQKGKCACCGVNLKKVGYHLDHIVPLSLGGRNDDSNIQLLCPTCNLSKGAKDPVEFMQSKGKLI